MDRLPALITAALVVAGCNDRRGDAADPPSRVDVAKAGVQKGATLEAFCDVYAAADRGPVFAWPALAGAAPAAPPAGTWRWINVWASYCKPCLEEMPRLVAWRDQLGASGHPVDLEFLSIDESAEALAGFRAEHPGTPASLRVADPAGREAWWKALGLDRDPPIPVNIFVTPSGHVRCARAGGIRDQDRAMVDRLLSE